MNTLLYIHGFNSSELSHKAMVLRNALDAKGLVDCFLAPRLSWQPARAIDQLEHLIEAKLEQGITLVGSSLGGFYACYLAEKYRIKAILVNPAVKAPELLTHLIGPQHNPYTEEDYVLSLEHMAELEALVIKKPTPEQYWLMLQEGDEVLDYRDALQAFPEVARLTHEQGGDHRFTNFERFSQEILEFSGILKK